MMIPYTYWKSDDGWYVGYWNDYPDHSTQGRDLPELEYMLRDLRNGIDVMVANGEIPSATPCSSGVMVYFCIPSMRFTTNW